jgi:hypothetical protein
MTEGLWCIGTTLAGLVNIETLTGGISPHIFDGGLIPLLAPVRTMTGSGGARFDGFIQSGLHFDVLTRPQFNALIVGIFGGWAVGEVERYIIAKDESEAFSPFLVKVIRPLPRTRDGQGDYDLIDGGYGDVQNLRIPLNYCRLQSVTKSANATLTTSERLVYANSGSGSITQTLPLAAAVAANTPVRIEKTAAANNVVVQKQGSDVFAGATLTALAETITLVSDGVSRWSRWTD